MNKLTHFKSKNPYEGINASQILIFVNLYVFDNAWINIPQCNIDLSVEIVGIGAQSPPAAPSQHCQVWVSTVKWPFFLF